MSDNACWCLALQAAEHIVLWGGNTTSVQALLRHYPDLAADKLVRAEAEAFLTHYDTLYRCRYNKCRT